MELDKYPNDTHRQRSYLMMKLAIPSMLSSVLSMLIEIINLIFVGHLNDPAMLAGVGMGNMTCNLCALSIVFGFNSSLDTLVSQAAGRGDAELCGVFVNRGRFVMLLLFIPITTLLLNTKSILVAIGQDEIRAGYAEDYVLAFLPGLVVGGLVDI